MPPWPGALHGSACPCPCPRTSQGSLAGGGSPGGDSGGGSFSGGGLEVGADPAGDRGHMGSLSSTQRLYTSQSLSSCQRGRFWSIFRRPSELTSTYPPGPRLTLCPSPLRRTTRSPCNTPNASAPFRRTSVKKTVPRTRARARGVTISNQLCGSPRDATRLKLRPVPCSPTSLLLLPPSPGFSSRRSKEVSQSSLLMLPSK